MLAQPPLPLGGELLVNAYTSDTQITPAIASDANGNFVVVWRSNLQDGSSTGIFARRFNSSGAPLALEFQVNDSTLGFQTAPVVDMNASGAFVVAWESESGVSQDIFARRFNSDGAPLSDRFRVNTYTTNDQQFPAIGIDSDGDFVVVWESLQFGARVVLARRYNAAGTPLATPFQVNATATTLAQQQADIDLEPDGDFVVVWNSRFEFISDVLGRRFNSSGIAQSTQFEVPAYSSLGAFQDQPRVRIDADGDFVVAWRSFGQDGYRYGVFARRFNSAGAPLSGDLQANLHEAGQQIDPDLAVDASGDFVVVWTSLGFMEIPPQDGDDHGVFARRFHANGTVDTVELQANTITNSSQQYPSVATDPSGDFVVAWSSTHTTAPGDIFARRYGVQALFDVDGNGLVEPLKDGILILRFAFGFTGETLIDGAVGDGCTRCDAPATEAYLQIGL